MKNNFFFFRSKNSLYKNLAKEILDIAKKSITEKGSFSIVLTGGKSIIGLYKILSKSKSDFDNWYIYITDERCLIKDHHDRNDASIQKLWLNKRQIPEKNINFIHAELGLAEACKAYQNIIDEVLLFDVVLLSIGEDGHIASLFPGRKYNNAQSVIIEKNSPKFPKKRISMSFKKLSNAKHLFKIIIGKSKMSIVKRLSEDKKLPANCVNSRLEKTYINTN